MLFPFLPIATAVSEVLLLKVIGPASALPLVKVGTVLSVVYITVVPLGAVAETVIAEE